MLIKLYDDGLTFQKYISVIYSY